MELESEVIKNMDEDYKKYWETFKYEMRHQGDPFPSVLDWTIEGNNPEGGDYNAYLENEEHINIYNKDWRLRK